jgi:hypothetical protein
MEEVMKEIMEENKIKDSEVIDLRAVFIKIWDNRWLFYKVLPIVFVLSCIFIFSIPRYYISNIKLAPEMESSGTGGTLGSIASSFGIDLSDMQTSDAITPLLYPDLMEDNGFVASLMSILIKSQDGELNSNYHDYLKRHQKFAWWEYPVRWVKSLLPKKKDEGGTSDGSYDPYNLPKSEDEILNLARDNINIAVDKKTGVVSISVEAQDPLICKTLADSIKEKLQVFITEYRTNKARTDYEYYKKLAADAKQDYEKVRRYYASLTDASTNVKLRSVELKIEDVENDMQLKFNTYTTINTQLQAAKAKVQEKTPAFTLLKGAAVPVKPAGPKRMLFVAEMLFLACFCISMYILKKILKP